MDQNLKCHYVKQIAIYSNRILYGYKCDMDALMNDINVVKRYINIDDNIIECAINGAIINELNKYKQSLKKNYTSSCRGC